MTCLNSTLAVCNLLGFKGSVFHIVCKKSFLGQFSADESKMYNDFITLYTNQEKDNPSEITGSYEFHTFTLHKVPQLFDLAQVLGMLKALKLDRKSDWWVSWKTSVLLQYDSKICLKPVCCFFFFFVLKMWLFVERGGVIQGLHSKTLL